MFDRNFRFDRVYSMSAFAQLPSILVVEDNEKDLELLQCRFRDAHLMNPVRVVRNGLEATRYLDGEGEYEDRRLFPLPGIVILDLHPNWTVLRCSPGFALGHSLKISRSLFSRHKLKTRT